MRVVCNMLMELAKLTLAVFGLLVLAILGPYPLWAFVYWGGQQPIGLTSNTEYILVYGVTILWSLIVLYGMSEY